ncbi:MAG: RDD family protein [Actinobacteria bacterium]|nr:RDD family protein [Actinomycetota bacterium]
MSRWTQTWLQGPPSPEDGPAARYRGERLRLPERGPGSVAGFGARLAAITIDWLPCVVVANLATENPPFSTLALFAALTALTVGATGRSPGHAALGLRVADLDGGRPGWGPAVVRTLLICLVVPPLVYDIDGRGLHDRAVGTVVLRER